MTKYVLQKAEGSYCPKCHKIPYLLVNEDVKPDIAFYICFDCKFIGQVGVGEVRFIGDENLSTSNEGS